MTGLIGRRGGEHKVLGYEMGSLITCFAQRERVARGYVIKYLWQIPSTRAVSGQRLKPNRDEILIEKH